MVVSPSRETPPLTSTSHNVDSADRLSPLPFNSDLYMNHPDTLRFHKNPLAGSPTHFIDAHLAHLHTGRGFTKTSLFNLQPSCWNFSYLTPSQQRTFLRVLLMTLLLLSSITLIWGGGGARAQLFPASSIPTHNGQAYHHGPLGPADLCVYDADELVVETGQEPPLRPVLLSQPLDVMTCDLLMGGGEGGLNPCLKWQ